VAWGYYVHDRHHHPRSGRRVRLACVRNRVRGAVMLHWIDGGSGLWATDTGLYDGTGRLVAPVKPPRPDLGPNQLAWLKSRIPSFNETWQTTERVQAEAEASRRLVGK
jgi:hypothetical protein